MRENVLELLAELFAHKPEMHLENLPDVHTAWDAERIQNDFYRFAVFGVGHVDFGDDVGHNALVAVSSRHFVADFELALGRDIDFDELHDTAWQNVVFLENREFFLMLFAQVFLLFQEIVFDLFIRLLELLGIAFREVCHHEAIHGAQLVFWNQLALFELLAIDFGVCLERLFGEHEREAQHLLAVEHHEFVMVLEVEARFFLFIRGNRALVFVVALLGENLDINDSALEAWRAIEGFVHDMPCLFAKDGAQQALFGRGLDLAFGRDLANENHARLDIRADFDDSALIEVCGLFLAHIGNVARDFLDTMLELARLDFLFVNMHRCENIAANELFAHDNRVFEVVAIPWHKRHANVLA